MPAFKNPFYNEDTLHHYVLKNNITYFSHKSTQLQFIYFVQYVHLSNLLALSMHLIRKNKQTRYYGDL